MKRIKNIVLLSTLLLSIGGVSLFTGCPARATVEQMKALNDKKAMVEKSKNTVQTLKVEKDTWDKKIAAKQKAIADCQARVNEVKANLAKIKK
jgi:predicted  nucleic acid-binding Zn-ribbon protein